jgi:hypothetical protein
VPQAGTVGDGLKILSQLSVTGLRICPSMNRRGAYGVPVDGAPFGRYRLVELLGIGGLGMSFPFTTRDQSLSRVQCLGYLFDASAPVFSAVRL